MREGRYREKNTTAAARAIDLCAGDHESDKRKSDPALILTNGGITARNERISALADGKKRFYIDVNEVVCDENRGLKESPYF